MGGVAVFACAGLGVNRWRSPGDLGRRARVWVKVIGFQLGDSLVDAEMGIGATHQGCRSLGKGNFAPGGVAQRERRRGRGPDAEGVADMPDGRCSGNLFLGIAKGLRTTRLMLGASCPSSNVWRRDGRSGGTPKRAPILTRNGRAFGRSARFGQGIGWLARKLSSRVPPCLRVMVRLSLTCIQTADVTPWSCTPSIPTASWQASSDGKSSPSRKTQSLEFPSELEELQRRDPGWVKRNTTTQLVAVKRPILRVGETGVRSVSPLIRLRIKARPMTGRPCGR